MNFEIKNIVIIDDDLADQKLIKLSLKKISKNFAFHEINDGEKALRHFKDISEKDIPDLVLLDLNLPRVNGIVILDYLKGNSHLKKVPVILLSTSSPESNSSNPIISKADGFYTKPESHDKYGNIFREIFTSILNKYSLPQ